MALARFVSFLGLLQAAIVAGCSLSVLDGLSGGKDSGEAAGAAGDVMPASDASAGSFSPDVSAGGGPLSPKESGAPDAPVTMSTESGMVDATMDVVDASGNVPVDSGSCSTCPGNGYCFMNDCAYASCADRLASKPSPNGVYWIDSDGKGGADPPFRAYCEMAADLGGWTLVMKIDGSKPTFLHDDPLWTNTTTYQVDFPDLDRIEAKLISFRTMSFGKIRIGIVDVIPRWLVLNVGASSMWALMNQQYVPTALGRTLWKGLVSSGSLQANCNKEGINVTAGAAYARIGILSNNDMDCNSCDSWIGFGGRAGADTYSCGNVAYQSSDNGDRNNFFFGYVMVK